MAATFMRARCQTLTLTPIPILVTVTRMRKNVEMMNNLMIKVTGIPMVMTTLMGTTMSTMM